METKKNAQTGGDKIDREQTMIGKQHNHDVSAYFYQGVEAYFSLLKEAMMKGAMEHGLSEETAKNLVFQTMLGAAEMLEKSGKTPEELRRNIMSPGGTTEAAISVLEQYGYKDTIVQAIIQSSPLFTEESI